MNLLIRVCAFLLLGLAICNFVAPTIADDAPIGLSQYLIGYREYRTNLPGGRNANDVTSRAYVVCADGTGRRQLAPELIRNEDTASAFIGWSPDGRTVIVGIGYNSPENAAWEEANRSFRFEGRKSDCYLIDLATGRATNVSAPERMSDVNQGVSYWPGNPHKLLGDAIINGMNHPISMDLDGRNKRDLTGSSVAYTYGAQVSPDGKRIAYHSNYQIYMADADGSNPRHVDTGNDFTFMPKWSPDGRWLLFLSGEHYNCNPYLVRTDGTELRKLADRQGHRGVVPCFDVPDHHDGSSDVPAWSSDGTLVYYTALVDRSLELMQTTLHGEPKQLTRSTAQGTLNYMPTPSPDGRWILFGSNSSGTRQLYVMPADGGQAHAITTVPQGWGAMFSKWSPVPIPSPSMTLSSTGSSDRAVKSQTSHRDTSIVVNRGCFPSAEAAAHAEAQVNWFDADTADDIACTECFAALELQRYLRQITARPDDFAIVAADNTPEGDLLVIGGPASNATARQLAAELGVRAEQLAALGSEGYRIKTASVGDRSVTLVAGGGRIGTLYGVYDLLHRMGCRWFGPGDLNEEVPHAAWQPEFDVTARPAFADRGFFIEQKRGNADFWLWMARNRLNYWSVQVDDVPLLKKLGFRLACGGHDAQYLFLKPEASYPYKDSRFASNEQKPTDPYPVSSEYQGDANQDGKLSTFEAHPEWFPLVSGKRMPGIGESSGTNLCTSNPHAVTEFSKNYVQALVDGIYRSADAVNLWALDQGQWCECPQCNSQGIPTDRFLHMVYCFDQQLKQARREGKLSRPIAIRFLTYMDLVAPPTTPLPTDFDYETCMATFYPISRCYVHDFDDPACPRNANYQQQLRGWVSDPNRHYQGGLEIGEYYNVSRFESLPICFMRRMAHDIPCYYRTGARSFQYMHVPMINWGNKSLTNYQMARQLWDVGLDCDALWQDYFARRYGPAADIMQRFYDSLEQMFSNIEPLKGWSSTFAANLDGGAAELFTDEHLCYRRVSGKPFNAAPLVEMVEHGQTCRQLIDQAMTLPLPERSKARIAEDERMFTYGERTLSYYDECVQAYDLGRAGRRAEALPHLAEARRIAELLQKDTCSVALAILGDKPLYCISDPARPYNAFEATFATQALTHLAKLLDAAADSQSPSPTESK